MPAEFQDELKRLQGTEIRRVVSASTNQPVKIHRIVPKMLAVQAWVEQEKRHSCSENHAGKTEETKRLLESDASPLSVHDPASKSRIQDGLTIRVWDIKDLFLASSRPLESKHVNIRDSPKRGKRIYDLLRPPYFIVSIIVIFTCMEAWAPPAMRAALEYAPGRRREVWRLLSYCSLHAGAQHLALNALVALAVGWVLEREQGAARVAALWCGGAVAGALGASVFQPAVHVIGASAGVYALLTAHLANVYLGYGHIPLWWFRVLAVAVLGASDLAWVLLQPAGPAAQAHTAHAAHDHSPVAWAAHALGAAIGLPLALLIFTGENSGQFATKVARWVSAAALACGAVAAVLSNVYIHEDIER